MFIVIRIVGIVLGLIPVVFGGLPASADPKKMLIEKDWGAYRYDDSAGRICFISSVPTAVSYTHLTLPTTTIL